MRKETEGQPVVSLTHVTVPKNDMANNSIAVPLSKVVTTAVFVSHMPTNQRHWRTTTTTLLQPFYGPLDFVWDYSGEPAPER